MKEFRNWIEEALQKRIVWMPVRVGMKGGREIFCVDFEDGGEGDYFIDFEAKTVEAY